MDESARDRETPIGSSIGVKKLEMMEYGLTQFVRGDPYGPLGSFSNSHLETALVQTTTGMKVKLLTYVLADRLPPVEVDRKVPAFFVFPRSPFQHWKQKHADAWWLRRLVRRWPVRTTQHTQEVRLIVNLQRYRNYPEADVPVPDNFGQVRFAYEISERIERRP